MCVYCNNIWAGNEHLVVTLHPQYPLPNQEATTVAEVLVKEFVCRFGTPQIIHSDQGQNFESAVLLRCVNFWG